MAIQREVRRYQRTQAEIDAEARSERLSAILGQIEVEIDSMKAPPDGEYRPSAMPELEAQLRRLADRANVAGSPFTKLGE
jgi:hypothetical protein